MPYRMMLLHQREPYITGGVLLVGVTVGTVFYWSTADVADGCTCIANRHPSVPACLPCSLRRRVQSQLFPSSLVSNARPRSTKRRMWRMQK